jgi:excisionase family DNA binding protein
MPEPASELRVGTARDAAKFLKISVDRVYDLAQLGPDNGGIPSLRRVGSRLRFDMDELARWLRDGGQG